MFILELVLLACVTFRSALATRSLSDAPTGSYGDSPSAYSGSYGDVPSANSGSYGDGDVPSLGREAPDTWGSDFEEIRSPDRERPGSGIDGGMAPQDATAAAPESEEAPAPTAACEDGVQCLSQYDQCAGGHLDLTACCAGALECVKKNAYYGQCLTRTRADRNVATYDWDGSSIACGRVEF